MKISYSPTFRDYLALNLHAVRKQFRGIVWLPIALLVAILFLSFASPPGGVGHRRIWDAHVSALDVLPIPAVIVVLVAAFYWGVKKRWASADELREAREYELDDRGVHFHASSGDGFTEWRIFKEAAITKRFVYLRTGQRQFHYFPVAAVPDVAELRALLVEKIGKVKGA